ncbi:hypothetical protein, partial [Klebsiella aerogenes]|uniref:hypothetical protein n=1 Tax=Klebsiella aerogenes TaxID=548 RepID=UPI001953690D
PTPRQLDIMTAVAAYAHNLLASRARRVGNGLSSPLARTEWVAVTAGKARLVKLTAKGDALDIDLTAEGRTLGLEAVDWRPGKPLFQA